MWDKCIQACLSFNSVWYTIPENRPSIEEVVFPTSVYSLGANKLCIEFLRLHEYIEFVLLKVWAKWSGAMLFFNLYIIVANYLSIAQIELSRSPALIQSCNRHAIHHRSRNKSDCMICTIRARSELFSVK